VTGLGTVSPVGGADVLLVRLTAAAGAPLSYLRYGNVGNEGLASMQLDADGGLGLSGTSSSASVDFGGGSLSTSSGGAYVVRFDAQSLAHVQSFVLKATAPSPVVGISPAPRHLLGAGLFTGTIDPGSGPLAGAPPGATGWVGTFTPAP
jgi:hypothetical protein